MIGVNSLLFLVHRVVFAFCTSYNEGFRENRKTVKGRKSCSADSSLPFLRFGYLRDTTVAFQRETFVHGIVKRSGDARTRVSIRVILYFLLQRANELCLTVSFRCDYRFSESNFKKRKKKRKKKVYENTFLFLLSCCTFKRLTIGMFGNTEHEIGSLSLRVSRKRRSLVSMYWQPVTRN